MFIQVSLVRGLPIPGGQKDKARAMEDSEGSAPIDDEGEWDQV